MQLAVVTVWGPGSVCSTIPAVATWDMQTRCRAAMRPGFPYASLTGDMYPPSTSYPLCIQATHPSCQAVRMTALACCATEAGMVSTCQEGRDHSPF